VPSCGYQPTAKPPGDCQRRLSVGFGLRPTEDNANDHNGPHGYTLFRVERSVRLQPDRDGSA
jgi:hypothetical protein